MGTKGLSKILLFALLVVGLVVGGLALYNHRHRASLAQAITENLVLQEPAVPAKPRLPAPHVPARSWQAEPEPEPRTTNWLARLIKSGELPNLTTAQIEAYLAANPRNAAALLAAYQATGDNQWLEQAKEKFPNDPAVAYAALSKSASPEERRLWLDTFKRVAPDNALANYLSASAYFKEGRTDEAVSELEAAYGKPNVQDYWVERVQNAEEAYQAAGYSVAEAKAIALASLQLPQLAPLKQIGQNVLDLAASYRQAGDEASAQAALQIGMSLGQRLVTGQGPVIQDLVGIAIQRLALGAMDPASPSGFAGQTVKDRMDQLLSQRQNIKTLCQTGEGLLATLPDQDLVTFFDREKLLGETPAVQWLVAKYGKQ
jgi:hypothetical protein